jgi:hypothetical protein
MCVFSDDNNPMEKEQECQNWGRGHISEVTNKIPKRACGPDKGNSQCKGPEVGFFGAYLRKMEASVTGVGLVRG